MIRRFILLAVAISLSNILHSQRIESDSICIKDTVLVDGPMTYPKDTRFDDLSDTFLATYCDYKKKYGFRFGIAFSQYLYSKSVADWLGFHRGINLNFIFVYKHLNFGFRFKTWPTNPKSELSFDSIILPESAQINPFKFDYYVGYDLPLGDLISIEPSVGYTTCTFKVINEETLTHHYSFNSTGGFILGLTFNKYIPVSNYRYIVLFGRVNHGFVNFSEVHSLLNGGYTEICLGISYKIYRKNRKYNVVKSF